MILTIAIPTYNRPDKIKNTVSRLLPQVTADVKILVLDNCSPVPVKDHLEREIGIEVSNHLEIVRHRVNIGADSNFQRCFELCTTPYIWMLGDDDQVEGNAVEIILDEIKRYEHLDLIGINFKSNLIKRQSPIFISSISDLSTKLDNFGNWSFISTSIYRTEAFVKNLQYAAWGTYAMSSQLIPTMKAISTGKTFVLSEKYIVTHIPALVWSDYQFALGLSSLLEAPVGFKKDEYKSFAKTLAVHFNFMYPADAFYTVLKSVNFDIDLIDDYHVYIFGQLIMKTFEFRQEKFLQWYQYQVCRFLLKNKTALKGLLRAVPKVKRKAEEKVPFYLFKR